ncbi:MAG: hypothetical protein ABW066_16470 [Sedimenticola sp.]
MKCKLTGNDGSGIRAHIIPKSFYAINPEEKLPVKLITNTEGHYSQKCPVGVYDTTIVTEEGERVFTEWDHYASELLLENKAAFEPIARNGDIAGFQIPKYDYIKLKLFFLSVLWRASVSSQPFFRRVDLGPHEVTIRKALLDGDPGDSDWYAVCLAKWTDHPDGAGMMDPYRTRFFGLNYYVMYLEHYIAYIKVDKRIVSSTMRAIQLKPDSPLIAAGRELNSSKELPIMVQMVNADAQRANK